LRLRARLILRMRATRARGAQRVSKVRTSSGAPDGEIPANLRPLSELLPIWQQLGHGHLALAAEVMFRMSEQHTPPVQAAEQEAIDVNDFVYAATGARVRRLTLPDGTHWFPAADVCRELGHTNPSEALRRHVPEAMRCVVATLISREGLSVPAGQGLRKSMVMVSLNGLIRLVNGCVKAECEPFKNWVTEVIVAVQRDGSYALDKSRVPAATDNATTGYVLPDPVLDVIVRLEERNTRLDEEFAAGQRQTVEFQRQTVEFQRQTVELQRETLRAQRESARVHEEAVRTLQEVAQVQQAAVQVQMELARTMVRVAESLECIAERLSLAAEPAKSTRSQPRQPELSSPMEIVDAMSWHEFEEYVARLCRRDGCMDVVVSGRRGDLGADIVGRTSDGRRLVVQCKHYAPHRVVPNVEMQKFVGTAMLEHHAEVAVFVATCAFSQSALELAERRGITVVSRTAFQTWNAGARLEAL
jgi:prophage antirepressor-like protein/restriction endonuclease Mrr